MTDHELIEAWRRQKSDEAFAELVNRYLNLVYTAALRQVRDTHLAQDVAQAVFLVLARKAASLDSKTVLAGWFFRTTRFIASRAVRGEARRHRHEQEAATMNAHSLSSERAEAAWKQIEPMLDQAVATLPTTDRDAVVLRFFQGKPMRQVGERLGMSEDAAKKRVGRAVDKLKRFFARRGVSLSVAVLAGALGLSGAEAAPPGLATRIAAGKAGPAAGGVAAALAAEALRYLLWVKVRLASLVGVSAVALLLMAGTLLFGRLTAHHQATGSERSGDRSSNAPLANADILRGTSRQRHAADRLFVLGIRAEADNQPLAGARVLAHFWGSGDVLNTSEFKSDTNGICDIPIPGIAFETLRLWVAADDFVSKSMDWHSYELGSANINYTTKLARGLKLEGIVRDEQGRPISGVKVGFTGPGINMTEREHVSFHPRLSGVESDASGHFLSRQMPSQAEHPLGLVLNHPDYAPQWNPVAIPDGLRSNWVLVLTRGVAVSGRVVDTNGWPIGEAALSVMEPHGGTDVSAVTDAQGDFTMPHVPEGLAHMRVTAPGFRSLERNLMAESNTAPVALEMQPADTTSPTEAAQPDTARLSGTVVDASSGEPLPQFKVLLDEMRGTSRTFIGEGHQGKFDWQIRLTFASQYTVEIDADGYEPQVSTIRKRVDGGQAFEFRLKQGGLFVGRVLQPDGQPAAGATIGLQAEGSSLHFQPPARLVNYGHPANETASDSQGVFSLKASPGMHSLLVVHESGSAALPAKAGTNLLVQLQAWGAIEGRLYLGKTPAVEVTVDVGFQSAGYAPGAPQLSFDLMQKTDSAGRFRFDRVPPGEHTVYQLINLHSGQSGEIGFSHGARVIVNPGETAQVILGGKGRVVIGRFVLPAAMDYDWSSKLVALVQDRPDLSRPADNQFPPTSAYWEASRAYDAAIAKYYLRFQPDGSFRADDVSPGQYTLSLTITGPPTDPLREDAWMYPGKALGGITNRVVVPDLSDDQSDTPLDLGTINIPIKPAQTDAHTAQAQ